VPDSEELSTSRPGRFGPGKNHDAWWTEGLDPRAYLDTLYKIKIYIVCRYVAFCVDYQVVTNFTAVGISN
jgi:hypothetical protein